MYDSTLYEFPLNERMRNLMRLENLFAQITHFAARGTLWDSQASLLVLIEILNIMERHDIKNEVTKELTRNIGILNNLLDAPAVNSNKLQNTLDELATHLHAIENINVRLARTLREDDLLSTIRQRVTISSSINNFELPSYYYWLNQSGQARQEQLYKWLEESLPIADAISLLLDLIRNSANFESNTAEAGFFQKSLSAQQICQMVRIELPIEANYFPESSGSKHRISVRFLKYESTKHRPAQVTDNVSFDISCCGI